MPFILSAGFYWVHPLWVGLVGLVDGLFLVEMDNFKLVVCLAWFQTCLESLILAQDERWRRA